MSIFDRYAVEPTEEFKRDFREILQYIARREQDILNSVKFSNFVNNEIEKLSYRAAASHPPFITLNGIKLYRYNIKHYAVFYTIDGDTVYVRRIIHSSRDLRKALRRSTVIRCL